MSGSGARIYIAKMPIENTSVTTLCIEGAVPTVLIAVVAGAANRVACEHLFAAATPQITGAAPWVSASLGHHDFSGFLSFYLLEFLWERRGHYLKSISNVEQGILNVEGQELIPIFVKSVNTAKQNKTS